MSAVIALALPDAHTAKEFLFAGIVVLAAICILVTRQWHDGGFR